MPAPALRLHIADRRSACPGASYCVARIRARLYRPAALLLLAALAWLSIWAVVPADAQDGPAPADDPAAAGEAPPPDELQGIPYTVTVAGPITDSARSIFDEASELQRQTDRLPTDIGLLRRRAREDARTLTQILKSEGFFAAEVEVEMQDEQRPVPVVLKASEGTLFLLAEAEIRFPDTAPKPDLPDDILAIMGLHIGMAAVSSTMLAGEVILVDYLKNHGWPYARVRDRDATVVLSDAVMNLIFLVDPGPPMTFGEVTIEGLEDVEPTYIRQRIPWAAGQAYDASEVKRFRNSLAQSGLFSLVTAAPPRRAPEEAGPAPVTIKVEEAKPRSIGAGVSYSSTDGPGVTSFWEHRNLFGLGQSLRLSGELSQLATKGDATFRWPWFLEPRQTLALQVGYGELDTEAYDVRGAQAYAGLERPLMENWKQSIGLSGELSRVESPEGRDNVRLAGLPVKLARDTSNDLLNPTEGSRLAIELTPYAGESDSTLTFLHSSVDGILYLPLDEARDFVLAGRVQVGSIVGENRSTIPANKRFYLGGGGSLRGYKYQSVSPLNASDQPIGGRSMFGVSAELRWRFLDDFGLVPFIDGGNAFDNVYPDFSEDLQWAAGLGFRYYTPIGPARLDLAFPLNRRSIDRSFEFYISLGQAF